MGKEKKTLTLIELSNALSKKVANRTGRLEADTS